MNWSNGSNVTFVFLCSVMLLFVGCNFFSQKAVDVSQKRDWTVCVDPSSAKAENEYDVIVVGSGIGGLSCASLLAKSGYKILVLEQHSQVGGYGSSYSRDGFNFTVGVGDVSGLWEKGSVKKLLDKLELNKDKLFVLNKRMWVLGDKKIITDGTKDDFIKQVSTLYPQELDSLNAFIDNAQAAILEAYGDAKPVVLSKWQTMTYKQKLDEFFKDEDLKKFLCSLLGYLGTSPEKTPAISALFACLQYFIYGGHYPKGGPQNFVDTLKRVVEKNGGKVLTDCRVDEILVKNGQVAGVKSGDKIFTSPIVVSNVNAKTTFCNLLPKGTIDQSFVDAISNLKMSFSLLGVQLGVDMDLSHIPSIVSIKKSGKKSGRVYHLLVNSSADASLAPAGKASISIFTRGNYNQTPELGTPEYAKFKEDQARQVIADIEEVIPNLSSHILVTDVMTPKSFERFTSMPEGAIYGFDQSAGSVRPYFKTPLKGLYLSSSSSFGGGVESVVVAGMKCAGDILGSKK